MSTFNRARDRDESGRLKRTYRRAPWQRRSPGYWVHLHMNRPRRRRNHHLCHLVVKGYDPECLDWPLGNRKPHLYYW